MPYIIKQRRNRIDRIVKQLFSCQTDLCLTDGDINYIITSLLHKWLLDESKSLNYERLERAIGVLECAKLELYRMVAAPYENNKRFDNGCISELDTIDGRSY